MIYYKNKEGKIIGKKSPSEEQIKIYKKEGFVECDENGNTKSKPKSKVSKAKKKWKDLIIGVNPARINLKKLLLQIWL